MIAIDHIAVPARDVAASARFLSELLGLPPARPSGQDGENLLLAVGESGCLIYMPAEAVQAVHIAFRVDRETFAGIVARLHAGDLPFGNDPEDQTNRRTGDFLGGHGRVFFRDPDDHLFEVMT